MSMTIFNTTIIKKWQIIFGAKVNIIFMHQPYCAFSTSWGTLLLASSSRRHGGGHSAKKLKIYNI